MMHIVIAPNAFKDSLNAEQAANAIQKGLLQSNLPCTAACFPIGDGGDGTGSLIVARCGGEWVEAEVHDALGRTVKASFGLIEAGKTAIIEMADASGIRLLKAGERRPLQASSFGTGELIKEALDRNVRKIVVGMGGSATVDGGMGILSALGVLFLDKNGNTLQAVPEDLAGMVAIDTRGIDQRIFDCELNILCDVDNPLLGKDGAARVFGPQKGVGEEEIAKLESMLGKFADIALEQRGKDIATMKHAGTAGGAAGGLHAFLGANLLNGIDYFLALTGFDGVLAEADLVITGEGSIDEQTLQGKGPYGVAAKAKRKNIPVIGLAGKVPLEAKPKLGEYFDVLLAIGEGPSALPEAMENTAANLTRTSLQLGNLLALLASSFRPLKTNTT